MNENNPKTWKIPVTWQSYGVMEVVADSLEEAKAKALGEQPLPTDSTYVDDSCEIDYNELDENQHD